MTDETGPAVNMSFDDSLVLAQRTFAGLRDHVYDFTLPRVEDGIPARAVITGGKADQALQGAVEMLLTIPQDHLVKLGNMAVAQRNNDDIDMWDPRSQRETVLIEGVMLSLLPEKARTDILDK
jgi:hypothetical protein